MKSIIKLSYLIGIAIALLGCAKEYGPYEYAPLANFSTTGLYVNENATNPVWFNLFLYNPDLVQSQSTVIIKGYPLKSTGSEPAVYGVDFSINPTPEIQDSMFIWSFNDSDMTDTIRFEITPLHNKLSIENKKFQFFIAEVSNGTAMGGQSSLGLTINNVDASIEGYSLSVSPTSVTCPNTTVGTISPIPAVLTITASGLTKDITVVKTAHFKFSLTNNVAEANDLLIIPLNKMDASGQITVYVFFAPTSSGLKSGALYIKSYGVKDARVALRGTGL